MGERHAKVAVALQEKAIQRLKGMKPLSFGERRMLDTARGLIVQELSVARSADTHKVEQELDLMFA